MKKLLFLAILLPWLALSADDMRKVLVVMKTNGEKVAVNAEDVDSIIFDDEGNVDSRYFLLDKDTVTIVDTIMLTDTLIVNDTIVQTDTVIINDTIIRVDTFEIHDTLVLTDTLEVHDTLQEYIPTTVNIASAYGRYHLLETPVVNAFINDFEYPDDDYSFSRIDDYLVETDYSKEHPAGVAISWEGAADRLLLSGHRDMADAVSFEISEGNNGFVFYNLVPGRHYFWRACLGSDVVDSDHFHTLGRVRMINTFSVHNVRDIGGIQTSDGRRTAYGRFFRGGDMEKITEADKRIMLDSLGITAEVDVRVANESTTSPRLGETVAYASFTGRNINSIPYPTYYGEGYASILRQVKTFLAEGKVVYLHCSGGADRTGAIALLLEGLAGCSESDIAKDYELTSFSVFGVRKRVNGVEYDGTVYNYASTLRYLKNLSQGNLQNGVRTYMNKIGLTDSEIDELYNLIIE